MAAMDSQRDIGHPNTHQRFVVSHDPRDATLGSSSHKLITVTRIDEAIADAIMASAPGILSVIRSAVPIANHKIARALSDIAITRARLWAWSRVTLTCCAPVAVVIPTAITRNSRFVARCGKVRNTAGIATPVATTVVAAMVRS